MLPILPSSDIVYRCPFYIELSSNLRIGLPRYNAIANLSDLRFAKLGEMVIFARMV